MGILQLLQRYELIIQSESGTISRKRRLRFMSQTERRDRQCFHSVLSGFAGGQGEVRSLKCKGMNSPIILFYSGEQPDDRGRYLEDIQRWPDDRLESVHDFIQWMFPLREPSGVNLTAPVLDTATIEEFRSKPELQEKLKLSFTRILRFYGMEIASAGLGMKVQSAPNFRERAKVWLRPHNHNHLRITRIINSLRLLGLEIEARAFFDCLAGLYDSQTSQVISADTFRYWQSAAEGG
jgi:opioid growth factor receptor-like protein